METHSDRVDEFLRRRIENQKKIISELDDVVEIQKIMLKNLCIEQYSHNLPFIDWYRKEYGIASELWQNANQ